MKSQVSVIHLLRKPLVGTVLENALRYQTGGLNIDGTRIGGKDNLLRTQHPQDNGGSMNPGVWQGGMTGSALGRWPANLILMHKPECSKVGEHYEEFSVLNYTDPTAGNFSFFAEHEGPRPEVAEKMGGQIVEEWECVEDCPCKDLDEQSGKTLSGPYLPMRGSSTNSQPFNTSRGWNSHSMTVEGQHAPQGYGDEGGVSRYFKQVQSKYELYEYLRDMISPPKGSGFAAEVQHQWRDLYEIETIVGLIIDGFVPTPEQVACMYQRLCPGGHICLFAPEEQPTGHTGVVRFEDAGFEVRDAILLAHGGGKTHYVPKANRKEREAGCSKLPAKRGFEAVDREEGTAGVNNPRAGAGRTASVVRNFHPCVKPAELMARLLSTEPKDQGPVLDPFLGSGSTLVACAQTGHSGVGIERDAEYAKIAEARVRYANRWAGAEILQEGVPQEEAPQVDVLDFLD